MKTLNIIIGLLLIATLGYAQPSTSDYMEMAQEAFDKKHYNGAISHSRVALQNEPNNTDALYLLIQSEMELHAYNQAERHLHFLLDTLKNTEFTDAYLHLARIKQSTGKYKEAKEAYALYLSEVEDEEAPNAKRARLGLESTKWAIKNSEIKNVEIQVNQLDLDVNSPYSEHAPAMYDGKLFFTSLRFPMDKDEFQPKRIGSKVINAENTVDQDFNISESDPFNAANKLTSNLSFNESVDKLVFSLCNYNAKDEIHCELYMKVKDANGIWMPSVKLPSSINDPSSTNTQACFGETVADQTDFYFVSNREGAKGMDIYHATFNENLEFTTPQNLDKLNTDLDEVTPYYNYLDKYIYFSSDGHNGYGGFDIFKATAEYEKLENIGLPTNTSYNEIFYRTFPTDEGINSYIASNRPGSLFLEEKFETCCYDLYKVDNELQKVELITNIFDNIQKNPLPGASIVLEEIDNPSFRKEENLLDQSSTRFDLDANKNYSLLISKTGFEDAELTVDAKSLKSALSSGTLTRDVFLIPHPVELTVQAFQEIDKSKLIGATALLTATGYEDQLKTNPSSNDFAFTIIPGVSYTLVVSKEGYHDLSTVIMAPLDDISNVSKEVYLKKITLMESLENLIPLTLFFDNDEPHPNSMATSTEMEYSDTFEKYYPKKNEFIETYTKLFKRSEREQKKYEMENFFENDVKKSYNEFNYFVSTLLKILTKGKVVNIYLRGYASPLSKNDYNTALGQRRIASVKNEFLQHDNGVLIPYINSGQLIITVRSFGEGTAKQGISDDPLRPEYSIFSLDASKERRVEIDEIVEVK